MYQCYTTLSFGYVIGADAFKESFCITPFYLVLCKACQIQQSNSFANCNTFFPHAFIGVVSAETIFLTITTGIKPFCPFPAKCFCKNSLMYFEIFINWCRTYRTTSITKFSRIMGGVHVLVFIYRFIQSIFTACPVTVSTWIHFADVNFSLSMNHPLGKIFAAAWTLSNTNACCATHPVIP